MDKDPDVTYADRFGRRNMEYISLGCDILPILYGRSPIQAYSDLMRNFRETFRLFLGGVITVRLITSILLLVISSFFLSFYREMYFSWRLLFPGDSSWTRSWWGTKISFVSYSQVIVGLAVS